MGDDAPPNASVTSMDSPQAGRFRTLVMCVADAFAWMTPLLTIA